MTQDTNASPRPSFAVQFIVATGLTLWVVENRIPMKRSQGIGSISDTIRRILIRIDTDAGISGYGEAAPWCVFSGTTEAGVAAIRHYLWPCLVGRSIAQIPMIMQSLDREIVGNGEAKAAVEIALHDIIGKASGLPIYQLLGGKARERIAFSFSLANPDLEADLELCRQLYKDGGRIFKIKVGYVDDHDEDVRRVARIREQLPSDIDIRLDYNQGLDTFGAISKLRQMEQFDPTFMEQPFKADHWDAMAELTARLDTPVMADESVFDLASAYKAAKFRIADAFSIKLMKAGGLRNARDIAAIAQQAGISCYGGTLFEGPIALNAGAHLIAATENISLGCEFYMPRYVMYPDELEADIDVRGGFVYPAEGPGIGISVDEDIIARTAIETLVL